MRTVSTVARTGLFAESSGAMLPILLEITHGVSGYPSPLRIVNNSQSMTYNGQTYLPFPFLFDPPDIKEQGVISNAKLTICAVDQQIAAILRSTQTAPTVTAVAAYWNDEVGNTGFEPLAIWPFTLRNVSGATDAITGDLIYEERLDIEYPALEFRPDDFPGVF